MIERIDGDLLIISKFFSQLVIMVAGSLILLLGILVAFFVEDIRMGTIFAALLIATVILLASLRNVAVPRDKANRDAISAMFGFIEERLSGTEDIRSSGAVDYVLLGLYKLHRTILTTWRSSESAHIWIRLVAGVMMSVGFAIAFVGGHALYRSGAFTIGTVYMVIHYTQLTARPIRCLTRELQNLQSVGANVERVNELFETQSSIQDANADHPITDRNDRNGADPSGPAAIRFDGVSFAYLEGEPVLKDVSFSIEPGSVLGVLGRTGSGKTTIARLIFRLFDADAGHALVDERDVRVRGLRNLRRRVAMVTQDVQIFQATVRQNLTFFDDSVTDDRLREVIASLGLSG